MNIRTYRELRVYQAAKRGAMDLFELTKTFPREELYSMVDQVRRSSRGVCTNLAEAWRRRRSRSYFISKLGDSECEAEETRVWLEFALECGYVSAAQAARLDLIYERITGQLVNMISRPDDWLIRTDALRKNRVLLLRVSASTASPRLYS